jgi:hypothetical protein
MVNNALSPPGSSAYNSDHMNVGDGTWDSQRNTFLLPNLQGFNLATTQYNGIVIHRPPFANCNLHVAGMGNRFRNMAGYTSLIKGHGILAVITFLFVVPGAILTARFYHRNPRMALRLHIWLQILTVLLSTALFVLGFQAVGLRRSLTNPHHGIGVALYTMIMVQALGGCIIHRREKGKERYKIPLTLMVCDGTYEKQIDVLTKLFVASPVDRKGCRHLGYRASCSWLGPIWFPKGSFHLVCRLGLPAPCHLLRSELP